MKYILIPVILSMFVWPGLGQFLNREFKKGIILFVFPFFLGFSLMLGIGPFVSGIVPKNFDVSDQQQIQIFMEAVFRINPDLFSAFRILIFMTWLYSVVDAYFGARNRLKKMFTQKKTSG